MEHILLSIYCLVYIHFLIIYNKTLPFAQQGCDGRMLHWALSGPHWYPDRWAIHCAPQKLTASSKRVATMCNPQIKAMGYSKGSSDSEKSKNLFRYNSSHA